MSTPDTKHGKEFERICTDAFKHLYMRYNCRWERTIDSAAANAIIRAADSDFRLLVKSDRQGTPYLFYVECKASKQGKPFTSLFRSLVKSGQNASMHAARRGGAEAFVLYYDMTAETIEAHRGAAINLWYPEKRKPLQDSLVARFPRSELDTFAESVVKFPQQFSAYLTEGCKDETWLLY